MKNEFTTMQRVYGSQAWLIYWKGNIVGSVDGEFKGKEICALLNQSRDDSVRSVNDASYAVSLAVFELTDN